MGKSGQNATAGGTGGQDDRNSVGSDSTVLKQGWCSKRSQIRSLFSFTSYRERWLELTRTALICYDGHKPESHRKEKERIPLRDVRMVENVSLAATQRTNNSKQSAGKPAFQIGYGVDVTVIVFVAKSVEDRDEWVSLIRTLCRGNATTLVAKFHPALYQSGKWNCCGETNKTATGCEPVTWTSSRIKTESTSASHHLHHHHHHDDVAATSAAATAAAAAVATSSPAANVGVTEVDAAATNGVVDPTAQPPAAIALTAVGTTNGGTAGSGGKVVVAVYPFTAIEDGDLTLAKGEEYVVLDDSQDHWWEVRNKHGEVGFIPSNYVKEMDSLGLQNFDWYVADISRQRAEYMLKNEDKEGCFVVRNSSTPGLYTLSLYTKLPHAQVKHYHIKQSTGGFFLSEKHCCASIPELIEYHSYNAGGLACRLKCPPGRSKPATAGLSHGKWEIDPTDLTLTEELGSGQFGVVRRGKWKGTIDVAVKMMKEGTMSEDDFIEEAKLMTKLQHTNLVQLYGVCSKNRPIFIITEYMKHGSLLHFLRRHKSSLSSDVGAMLDIGLQVCRGMAYLERHNYIHRDLAARNCLVGSENIVKVADFGLARYVIDDQYTSNGGAKFPIKWSPPEVLNYTRFSSKSDVWAFGVLCWEIMTCGEMPYGRAKNPEVVERVQRGQILSRPSLCPHKVYEIMRLTWAQNPDDRPAFRAIKEQLIAITQTLD